MFTKALFTIVFAVFGKTKTHLIEQTHLTQRHYIIASVHAAPSAKFCNGAIYSVKSGDTCDSIAQMFGVTALALINLHNSG
jgi:hypothetical protein